MNIKVIDGKPEIIYPCRWHYKVIGIEEKMLIKAILAIVCESEHQLSPSKTSKSGKYHSYNLEIFVESEEARNFFFNELRSHSAVTMVF
ncbi:MAG: DUF493 domain-containing protein [Desulfobulbaceae bacterium]|uniref:DUF493 domain-containing protein n=1 Tax=Candidatus Desulfobia pelagia TaxID=2841692 RepID=A0A8J6NDB3_9BACT|nr:DUF493 domain-containing protein [Candidatus Desulfobia pelagia]